MQTWYCRERGMEAGKHVREKEYAPLGRRIPHKKNLIFIVAFANYDRSWIVGVIFEDVFIKIQLVFIVLLFIWYWPHCAYV